MPDQKAIQVGGSHYSQTAARCPHCNGEIQHWDLYANAPGLVYSSTKHITRHRMKNGKEDLLKAITEIQKIIEQEYPEYEAQEELMRTEWPTTRPPESVADLSSTDVPQGWVLEEIPGMPGMWHYRASNGGVWHIAWPSRDQALRELRIMLNNRR